MQFVRWDHGPTMKDMALLKYIWWEIYFLGFNCTNYMFLEPEMRCSSAPQYCTHISIPSIQFWSVEQLFSSICTNLEQLNQASVVRVPYLSAGVLKYMKRIDTGYEVTYPTNDSLISWKP